MYPPRVVVVAVGGSSPGAAAGAEAVGGIPAGVFDPATARTMGGVSYPYPYPYPYPMAPPGGRWTTDLCDCSQDCNTCCMACWCPCIPFGQIAEILDRGTASWALSGVLYCVVMHVTLGMCQWVYSCAYRTKLRALYGLPEKPCSDCCVHFWCQACSIAQMYRELTNRGLDPSLGWEMNSRRMMAPPQPMEGMTRL